MTHTLATMEVTDNTYNEIKENFLASGYEHAVLEGGMLDMTGVGLVRIVVPVPGEQIGTIGGDS